MFIVNYGDTYQAYGWSKTFTNVSRTGLPGDAVKRSMTYFGAVEDFLADRPTVLTDDTYNTMSRAFYDELTDLREEYAGPPVAFLVRQFNEGTGNEELLDSGDASLLALGDDIAVVTGEGLTSPSDGAIDEARAAETEVAEFYADHPGILGNIGHNLWVILALGLLLVVPGLLAARFLELDDTWLKISLIPGISIALTVIAGVIVVAVHRAPFSTADGWATLGLATAGGAVLRFGQAPILRVLNGFGGFFNKMFSAFSNADFAALMGVQFLVMAADGLVRGSIAKSIAFGGQEGFDITTVPSADYLLKVVLALYVPYTFASPFIGVLIDRFERRRVLAVSSVVTAGRDGADRRGDHDPAGQRDDRGQRHGDARPRSRDARDAGVRPDHARREVRRVARRAPRQGSDERQRACPRPAARSSRCSAPASPSAPAERCPRGSW